MLIPLKKRSSKRQGGDTLTGVITFPLLDKGAVQHNYLPLIFTYTSEKLNHLKLKKKMK